VVEVVAGGAVVVVAGGAVVVDEAGGAVVDEAGGDVVEDDVEDVSGGHSSMGVSGSVVSVASAGQFRSSVVLVVGPTSTSLNSHGW
jgi:hypothetical protein